MYLTTVVTRCWLALILLFLHRPGLTLLILALIGLGYPVSEHTPSFSAPTYQVTWNKAYDPSTYNSQYAAQRAHLIVVTVTVANKTAAVQSFRTGETCSFYSSNDQHYWGLSSHGPASITLSPETYQTFDPVFIVPR